MHAAIIRFVRNPESSFICSGIQVDARIFHIAQTCATRAKLFTYAKVGRGWKREEINRNAEYIAERFIERAAFIAVNKCRCFLREPMGYFMTANIERSERKIPAATITI